jgi:UDP-galactopyranose mutase
MTYDYLIIGAGLFGATCARLLADAGQNVAVIERREHIAGNCFDSPVNGIPVSRYGGHIFHTNSRKIWDFVNRYSVWRYYEHRVKASYKGKVYSLPPNLATFDQIGALPGPEGERLIRRMFFEGYTQKQWGKPWEALPESVKRRVPVRYTYDDRYFDDRYQGVPEHGYTHMVSNMLAGIPVELGADFITGQEHWRKKAKAVIYSGALDELFGYDLGRLEYRSLEWRHQVIEAPDYQGCATINFTDVDVPFTRILEWQHYGWRARRNGCTLIAIEYPKAEGEPYYPIGDDKNLEIYRRYQLRLNDMPWLYVGGRLGSYRYYNMDQVIGQAMSLVHELGSTIPIG